MELSQRLISLTSTKVREKSLAWPFQMFKHVLANTFRLHETKSFVGEMHHFFMLSKNETSSRSVFFNLFGATGKILPCTINQKSFKITLSTDRI